MALTTDGIDSTIIDAFLEMLWERGGTDLLVTAGSPLRLRVDGALAVIPGQPALTEAQASELVVRIVGRELTEQLRTRKEVDFSFPWKGQARFRGNAFHQQGGYAMSLRMIPNRIPTLRRARPSRGDRALRPAPAGPHPRDRARRARASRRRSRR